MLGALFSALRGGSGGVDLETLQQAARTGSHAIVDVREPGEFASGHIAGAVNRPLSSFDPAALPKGRPVIILCLSGGRSARAHGLCRTLGRDDIAHYSGGMAGWRAAGLPVVTGKG